MRASGVRTKARAHAGDCRVCRVRVVVVCRDYLPQGGCGVWGVGVWGKPTQHHGIYLPQIENNHFAEGNVRRFRGGLVSKAHRLS